MARIVLTGGGTAGHVTPNLALIPYLQKANYDIHYIGSYEGMEKKLLADYPIPYYGIATGKFRRYFSLQNFSDPFRVLKGYRQAKKILKELSPDILFSKGGYVSVPVVRAAASLKIPCILHESDLTPGLANKLCIPVATKICCNFPETLAHLPAGKAILTGSPIRDELRQGDKDRARAFCGFNESLPVLMIIGGSLGAAMINDTIRQALPILQQRYQIIHLCGKGKLDESLNNMTGYLQLEYVTQELRDLFALADLVVSRAGANAICELLALQKPNLLIPLGTRASRGDQILNAASFASQGYSMVLSEEELSVSTLVDSLALLYQDRERYQLAMKKSKALDPIPTIMQLFTSTIHATNFD